MFGYNPYDPYDSGVSIGIDVTDGDPVINVGGIGFDLVTGEPELNLGGIDIPF